MNVWKAVSLVLWLALLVARPGAADGTDPDETLSPYFFVENGGNCLPPH